MAKTTLSILQNIIRIPQLWVAIIPIEILGLFALFSIFSGNSPHWWYLYTITGYICLVMLGMCACYHRLLSHRSFNVHPIIKKILLFFGIMSGNGSPIMWAAVHKGYHHRYSDTDQDLHSPNHGFWHAYIGWQFKLSHVNIRSVATLLKDKDIVFAHKHYLKIFIAVHIIVALINPDCWLYGLVLPEWLCFQVSSLWTSVCHCRWIGYKNFTTNDNSVNVPLLFPLLLGEAWHNNHHGNPRSVSMQKNWWELDPTAWLIKIIQKS